MPQWQLHLTTTPTSLSTSLLVSTKICLCQYLCNSVPPNYCWLLLHVTCYIALALWVVPHRSPYLPQSFSSWQNDADALCAAVTVARWTGSGAGWLSIFLIDTTCNCKQYRRRASTQCVVLQFLADQLILTLWNTSVKLVMQLSFVYFLLHPCLQLCTCNQNYSAVVMLINLEDCSQV